MSLIKIGENMQVQPNMIHSEHTLFSPELLEKTSEEYNILTQFKKVAETLKQIAPKAKDFLYFSAIMMHAAEASLLDNNGSIKKDAKGNDVTANWERNGESWKWVCSDNKILPYKNANADIFPEIELITAHKKWIGRPLCLDHKSSSVDMIRGVIVDTYYDKDKKRVIALCALDKINYPDLARKVSTGVAASVSMGTAVSKAICTDCGTVAKVEADFCHHMKNKSCYGEINVGLNPIELSIVVNGADPQAKIRHIVAAENSIARYLDMRTTQVNKFAEDENQHIELATEIADSLAKAQTDIADSLAKAQTDLDELRGKIEALKAGEEKEQQNFEDKKVENSDEQNKTTEAAILPIFEKIMTRIGQLDEKFNKYNEDLQMTQKKGYFQGAGGDNEPTPGKPRYTKEESDKIRDTQDKHMVDPQDTGPVDGLFPGDEQKKRDLLRAAEIQEREMKRQAALKEAAEVLEKNSYIQGGGGDNEPTPGKPKYTKEDSDKIREKDDKQMNGAPPFPGVGKIDGLYNKDLETKQKILRAKLVAKFIKAGKSDGSLDKGKSQWQVFADDKLILTASVDEITGNKSEALYSSIATEKFGHDLIRTIRTDGFEKAASLFKNAQQAPAAMPMAPTEEPMMNEPQMDANLDQGKTGDPKEMVADIAKQLSNLSSDLSQAADSLNEDNTSNELGEAVMPDPSAPPTSTASLVVMQKKLSKALSIGIKQTQDEVKDHLSELKLAYDLLSDKSIMKSASTQKKESIYGMVKDACNDSKLVIADGVKLMSAFVKYARGTEKLVKRAKSEIALSKTSQLLDPKYNQHLPGDPLDSSLFTNKERPSGGLYHGPVTPAAPTHKSAPKPVAKTAPVDGPDSLPEPYGDRSQLESMLVNNTSQSPLSAPGQTSIAPGHDVQHAKDKETDKDKEDENDVVKVDDKGNMSADTAEEAGKAMKAMKEASDLSSKEGRSAYRAKLAEKGMAFSDMLTKAHGKGGTTPQFDIKPTGDLAKVETLEETHKAMMDIANASPAVKKKAENIQSYVTAGKIDPDKDFPGLIAQGLDAEAVKYWKAFWGQAKDGGSDFGAKLVQDYTNKKAAEEKEAYKVKVSRAYSLAHEMAAKNLIGQDVSSINTQVDDMLSWTDEGFESVKKMVSRQKIATASSTIPNIGYLGGADVHIPAPQMEADDLKNNLESCFSNSWKPRW